MSLLGVVTGTAAFFISGGNPQAALYGYSIGAGVEGYLNQPDIVGPRLTDTKTQMNSYGSPITVGWGQNRQAGIIFWPKIIEAQPHDHTESAKGGGGPDVTTTTYTLSYAILLGRYQIAGIRRAWKNNKLVYDLSAGNAGPTTDGSFGALRVYLGTETQTQDPYIEAADGPGPAYLGSCYVFIEDDDVTEMQGRPNQWEFEPLTAAVSATTTPPTNLGAGGPTVMYLPGTADAQVWTVTGTNAYVYDPESGALLATVALPYNGKSITSDGTKIWVGYQQSGFSSTALASRINPLTFAIDLNTKYGYGGATSQLGTVVWNSSLSRLYGFINGGIGAGARYYDPATTATGVSGISVPDYVYNSLEMPDVFKLALAGFGNWLVVASAATDATLATITNTAWSASSASHRIQYDASRNCLYWAVGGAVGVYKIDLTTYALTLLVSGVTVRGLHYNPQTDLIYVDTAADLKTYSPDTGALIDDYAGYGVLTGLQLGNSVDPGSENYYFVAESSTPPGSLYKVMIGGRLNPQQVALSTIVSDNCVTADLETSDINVAALTDMVDGFKRVGKMSARSVIEALTPAYFFWSVESDGKIKFVKRGGAIAVTIPKEDRGVHVPGSDPPDSLNVLRAFEFELPYQCNVRYLDVDADHQPGYQYDRRTTKDTKQQVDVNLAIVMPGSKAKQVARITEYKAWLNQKFRWTTTCKYSRYEPTDVVELPNGDITYVAEVTMRRDRPDGVIEWEGDITDAYTYNQPGTGAATTSYLPQTIDVPDETILVLVDGPALLDEHDDAGFFVAMGGAL